LPLQKDFINDIRNLLLTKPQLTVMLSKDFFNYFYAVYSADYWTNDSRELLITLLISYIKFSISQLSASVKNETNYTIENFSCKFGQDCYKIFNGTRMKNVWILQSLSYSYLFIKK
jgi:hypothetical protein